MVALGERPPCFGRYTVFFHKSERVFLLKERVQLHLIDRGNDLCTLAQIGENMRIEVAHADGGDNALFVKLLHSAPRARIVAHRLMNEIKVKILETKLFQRGFKSPLSPVVACVLHPQLCGDEQVAALYTTLGYCFADGFLIHVSCRRVDQAVARGYCVEHRLPALCFVGHLKNAEALGGHFNSVV